MSPAPEQPTPSEPRPAPGPAPDPASFVRVRTTRPRSPFPPNSARQPIITPRLILRALTPEDIPALHVLRTQPEVMRWTALGRPDADLEETRRRMERSYPPNDTASFNFAICARGVDGDADAAGELIGIGGCALTKGSFGWPEVGYMLKKEHWGKGLATEFLQGWLRAWDTLEREVVEVEVDRRTLAGDGAVGDENADGEGGRLVRERLIAITAAGNGKSQRVLAKAGFEWFLTWLGEDLTEGAAPGSTVALPTYRYFPGGQKGLDRGEGELSGSP